MFKKTGAVNKIENINEMKDFYCENCGKKIGKKANKLYFIEKTNQFKRDKKFKCPYCNSDME